MARASGVRALVLRLAGAATVLVTVATLAFIALQVIPGDPAQAALGGPGSQAGAAALAAARAEFGLDRPVPVQYADFLWRLVRGDLGFSYAQRVPVTHVLAAAAPPTLALTGTALVIAWLLAFASVVVASGTSRCARALVHLLDLVAAAMPNFWLAGLLVVLFAGILGWLPPVSTGTLAGLLLPACSLAVPVAGFIAQTCRVGVDEARQAAFLLSAQTRGETETGLRLRHTIRHGIVPGINLTAWALGSLLSGAAVIEIVFARAGLGRTLMNAVIQRDIPVVLGVVLCSAFAYVTVSVVTDLVIARVDPRTETRLQLAASRA